MLGNISFICSISAVLTNPWGGLTDLRLNDFQVDVSQSSFSEVIADLVGGKHCFYMHMHGGMFKESKLDTCWGFIV